MAAEIKKELPQDVATEESTGAVVVNLKKPLDYNGHIYESLTFDLENLTGKDSMEVEAELIQRKKGAVIVGALNNDYILGIAAKAVRAVGATEDMDVEAVLTAALKKMSFR